MSEIGLKAGLEIHQQLDTDKLFCNCPSVLRMDEPDFVVRRKLHAVAGEEGKVDVAALHEMSKDKEFIYQGYHDTTCLVELDEEPPHEINSEALKTALQIAFLFNMKIIPIMQIMRKTVIDGSNTSGFQRTALIAREGWIETSNGRVGIDELYLEEDACRIIKRGDKEMIFRLDRLGVPLVEIKTAPDLRNPQEIKEAALKIGGILRNVKVKRGLGTIRQDLNISIAGHPRVEIKGFQEPRTMIKAVEVEMQRQKKIGSKGKSEVRNALPSGESKFLRPMPGMARMYPETDLPLLKISRDLINEVKKNMPKLKGDIEEELKKQGLTPELIKLILEGYLDDFESLLKIYPKEPQLAAKMLTVWRRETATKSGKSVEDVEKILDVDVLGDLLERLDKGLDKNQIRDVFSDLVAGKKIEDAVRKENMDVSEIEEKILKIIKSKPGLSEGAYMGLIMKEFKGKISGKDVMEIIQKYLK